jgi:S1-C subfamily serine protease
MRSLANIPLLVIGWLVLSANAGCVNNYSTNSSSTTPPSTIAPSTYDPKLLQIRVFKGLSNPSLCNNAMQSIAPKWATEDMFSVYVVEAIRRGISERECARLSGYSRYYTHTTIEKSSKNKTGETSSARPPQVAKATPKPKSRTQPSRKLGSTGSGFFVSKLGHLITNEHVVNRCRKVTVGDNAKTQVIATVLETDRRNDLALLRISTTKMASAKTKSLITKLGIAIVPLATQGLLRSEEVELGEDVLVAGFPFGDIFSNTIKVTKGIVSANRGMGDDTGQFQIDAAVQPGNSGGPIYDSRGNIVGVVVSQLNKLKIAKAIGSLPENVNFGIKASTVRQFLNASGLPTKWSKRSKAMSTRDLAKIAKNQTVMVVCHR